MQENGVPVTFAYISDAHDNHDARTRLRARRGRLQAAAGDYDQAFATFFQRLQHDGIDKSNTLFVVTVDEGDHFAGGTGTPTAGPGRAGLQPHPCATPTSCPANQIGEVNVNIGSALPAGRAAVRHPLRRRPDVLRQRPAGADEPGAAQARAGAGAAKLPDPYKGGAQTPIAFRLADTVEEKTLHMVNSDPKRTPTFTMFGERRLLLPDRERLQGPSPDPASPSASTRASPGTTATPGRDRQHVVRHGRARRRQARRRQHDLDRSHRPAADDQRAARPPRQLPRRRPGRHADRRQRSRCRGRSATAGGHEARRRLQADQRAVRAVRDGHADRLDGRAQDE